MFKLLLITLVPFLALFSDGIENIFNPPAPVVKTAANGILEKMIVADGTVSIDINADGSSLLRSGKNSSIKFDVEDNSFFTVMVFNGELRGALPSSMKINAGDVKTLPTQLSRSGSDLILENAPWGAQYELSVRDAKSGFVFFNIEGHLYDYDQNTQTMSVVDGRVLLSPEYAEALGRSSAANTVVGSMSISTKMRAIEITELVDGEVKSDTLPAMRDPEAGSVPGPDVVVGDLNGLAQFGSSSGTQVGLSVGTDSCNFGTVDLNWAALPSNDHPVIPQNMYRMSSNAERFEQISQSSVKHGFTALTENICGLGCNGVGGSRLGSGCSDPYVASLNSGGSGNGLGSRAWINPFTGFFPRGDSPTPPNAHSGHTHNGTSHRMVTEMSDLAPASNPGATYYAEAQYITPHEYAWCQSNPTQCNMYNNVSYRQYVPSGTTSFTFSTGGFQTQRQKLALTAWTGSTAVELRPAPGVDGSLTVAYKVTNPSAGVWHYEYAVYNMNLDRGIQSFSIPLGSGVTLSNVGFRSPPQHPGSLNDGTLNSLGFSSAAWAQSQTASAMTWSSETFAQNQNANAIRWGTLYNFRFDSNRPPTNVNATLGFFKTGSPATIAIQGPSPEAASNVVVAGRVLNSSNRGVGNARVTMVGPSGTRSVMTNSFGFYSFDNVATGASYTISVGAKIYNYTPQTMVITDNMANLNFTPTP